MQFQPRTWIVISGCLWLGIGIFLLTKGLQLLVFSGSKNALLLLSIAMVIGFVKGRFVLSKTVHRVTTRILSLPAPIKVKQVYGIGYCLLILSMIALGISMRWLPIPLEARGAIDIAIGSALFNGSILYFRKASALQT